MFSLPFFVLVNCCCSIYRMLMCLERCISFSHYLLSSSKLPAERDVVLDVMIIDWSRWSHMPRYGRVVNAGLPRCHMTPTRSARERWRTIVINECMFTPACGFICNISTYDRSSIWLLLYDSIWVCYTYSRSSSSSSSISVHTDRRVHDTAVYYVYYTDMYLSWFITSFIITLTSSTLHLSWTK